MSFQVRQGDVLIQRVSARRPSGSLASNQHPLVLARGEVTGHAHRLVALENTQDDAPAARLFMEPDGRRLLIVERTCVLMHDEHGPIALAPGSYTVTIQREYEPQGPRYVAD